MFGRTNEAGYTGFISIFNPLLPAAQTNNISELAIVSLNAGLSTVVPQLQFTILTPIFSAYSIAPMISLV